MSSLNLALLGLLCKEDFILLLSLSIMSSRFIPANSPRDFLPFRVWEYPVICNTLHSVYLPILQWACGCFCLWLLQIRLWISLEVPAFVFFMDMAKSRIAGSYGSSIFNFVRNYHTVFLSSWAIFIPTEGAQSSNFSTTSLALGCFLGFLGGSGGVGEKGGTAAVLMLWSRVYTQSNYAHVCFYSTLLLCFLLVSSFLILLHMGYLALFRFHFLSFWLSLNYL